MKNKQTASQNHIYVGLFYWTAGFASMALLVFNYASFLDGTMLDSILK